jgi:hypothetical protein
VATETSPYRGVSRNQPATINPKGQIALMKPEPLPMMAGKAREEGVQELQEFGSSGGPDRQRRATVIPKGGVRFPLAIFYSSRA